MLNLLNEPIIVWAYYCWLGADHDIVKRKSCENGGQGCVPMGLEDAGGSKERATTVVDNMSIIDSYKDVFRYRCVVIQGESYGLLDNWIRTKLLIN